MASFHAVALMRDQYDKIPGIEDALIHAVSHAPLPDPKGILLSCSEQSGPIPGFARYSNVFFFNDWAWSACLGAGFDLRATRIVDTSAIPAEHTLLVGP